MVIAGRNTVAGYFSYLWRLDLGIAKDTLIAKVYLILSLQVFCAVEAQQCFAIQA